MTNVVVLVGRVADRPFRPGGQDRVVLKLDVPSERRAGKPDRIEIHCFGAVGEEALTRFTGDVVSIRGRLELRIGRDEHGEYEDLRVVAQQVNVISSSRTDHRGTEGRPESIKNEGSITCDGTDCAAMDKVDGVIKFFRAAESYGFISTPNIEEDVFFHTNKVHGGAAPMRGDSVRFVLQPNGRGFEANHVTITTERAHVD